MSAHRRRYTRISRVTRGGERHDRLVCGHAVRSTEQREGGSTHTQSTHRRRGATPTIAVRRHSAEAGTGQTTEPGAVPRRGVNWRYTSRTRPTSAGGEVGREGRTLKAVLCGVRTVRAHSAEDRAAREKVAGADNCIERE